MAGWLYRIYKSKTSWQSGTEWDSIWALSNRKEEKTEIPNKNEEIYLILKVYMLWNYIMLFYTYFSTFKGKSFLWFPIREDIGWEK